MPVFDHDAPFNGDLAFQIAQDGHVSLFWSIQRLGDTSHWLADRGYQVVSIDGRGWESETDVHRSLAEALDFPEYYGANLAALDDVLRDVAEERHGADPSASGTVVVVRGFDRIMGKDRTLGGGLLDAFESAGRYAALFGRRLLWLVQSDDPDMKTPPIGAREVKWFGPEFLRSERGPE